MKISLVVPVFNEEETIPIFHRAARGFAPFAGMDVEIVFINDGSRDSSAEIVRRLMRQDPAVRLVDLTRNFGKEAALFAGLEHAQGDAVIPMDVDLQDPLEVIPLMIDKWQQGAEVVLAKRIDRATDGRLKRGTAAMFYWLHNLISAPRIEANVGDFRLISRPVLDDFLRLRERNLFMKGLMSWVGGRTDIVEYRRAPRVAGTTKFNGWKLWNLALEGITSFSTVPLRVWTYIGLLTSLGAFFYGAWMIFAKLAFGNDVPGYSSLIVAITFFGGVQLMGIGILGEYIGRVYLETKQRPRYLAREEKARAVAADGHMTEATQSGEVAYLAVGDHHR